MDFIAHVGGVFIYSEDAKALAEWYMECFEIPFEFTPDHKTYYVAYDYLDIHDQKKFNTVFSILRGKKRPKLDFNAFALNLRVKNIEELVAHLKQKGVEVKDIGEYPQGKFSQVTDPENNRIELWEDTSSEI